MATVEGHAYLGKGQSDELQHFMEALASLGVTPESIRESVPAHPNASHRDAYRPLDNDEWMLLEAFLPDEPSQSNTMDNRTFVNAVLEAMHRGGRWTDYPKKRPCSDAVRRRFGRWAHLGIWQRVADNTTEIELTIERKIEFKAIADRAERLRRKSA